MSDFTSTGRAAGDRTRRRPGRLTVLLVAGVVALAAACGDDSDPTATDDAAGQDDTTTEVDGSGDDANGAEPDTEADGDEASTDEASTDDEVATFCAEVAPLNEEADQVMVGDATDPTELRDLVDRLGQLDPPGEIAADYELTLEAFRLWADGLDGDTGAQAEFDERLDEFEAASERLEPFMRDVCGLDFGD